MGNRLISLAAGTLLDITAAETVEVGAAAGFDAVGIWFDKSTWTASDTAAVASRLGSTGVVALDIEPVILGRDHDQGDELIDVAAELGVRHVLVASGQADRGAVVERLGSLCERARPAGIVVVLEFLPIFSVSTLAAAVSVVDEADQPNGAVLIDTLHLARSGGSPADLRAVPVRLLPYLQVADAPAELIDRSREGLRDEALHGRLLPGDGALPLRAVLAEVPSVPISLELRSAALVASYPDPGERAAAVLAACRRLLATDPL